MLEQFLLNWLHNAICYLSKTNETAGKNKYQYLIHVTMKYDNGKQVIISNWKRLYIGKI